MISQKSEKSSEFLGIKWKWVVFCLLAISNRKRTFGKAWENLYTESYKVLPEEMKKASRNGAISQVPKRAPMVTINTIVPRERGTN